MSKNQMLSKKQKQRIEWRITIIIMVVLLTVSIIWCIAEIVLLPDNVIIQYDSYGQAEIELAKVVSIIVPFLLNTILILVYVLSKGDKKYAVLCCISYLLPLMNILLNI